MLAKCTGPECSRPSLAKNLCRGHYSQQLRGNALTPLGEATKGHWPDGKLRKPPTGTDVTRIIGHNIQRHGRGGVVATAKLLGVSQRTLRRWASGERYPSAEEVKMIFAKLTPGKFSRRARRNISAAQ